MTHLITAAGLKKLQDEYDQLRYTERPKVVAEMHEAAKDGDFSENAPYQYAKKRQYEIDHRLKHLGKRIEILKVAPVVANPVVVAFGTWVTFEDDDGKQTCYQLVGADEFDVPTGRISIDSPFGKALIGRKVDDEVVVMRPAGRLDITIIAISATRD